MGERQGVGEQDRIAGRPGQRDLVEHRRRIPVDVRLLGGEADTEPPGEHRVGVEALERSPLQRLDASLIERRAVLVHPDPAEPERGDRHRLAVTGLLGGLRGRPELRPRLAETAGAPEGLAHPLRHDVESVRDVR